MIDISQKCDIIIINDINKKIMTPKLPLKEIFEVIKNLNQNIELNKRFDNNEISISEYCSSAYAFKKMRSFNYACLIMAGGAFFTQLSLDGGNIVRDSLLLASTITIATAAAFNFGFNNFKNVYFETLKNKEHFKTKIIDESTAKINKKDIELMGLTLNSSELYVNLMWGNELYKTKTSLIINVSKKILNKIQEKWTKENLDFWNKNKDELENRLKINIENRKLEANEIIKKLFNLESEENKLIINNIKKIKTSDGSDSAKVMLKIKEINQTAIIKATELYNNQALELIFLKVVSDYSKGIKHERLLNMFKDLNYAHLIKENSEFVLNRSLQKMSSLSSKMLGGIDLLKSPYNEKENLTLADIAKTINPNLISNKNKIKFVSFENLLMNQKEAAINNYNKIKLPKINEISINKLDLDEILSIKKDSEKNDSIISKNNKLDKLMNIEEIYKKGQKNKNIIS